VKGVKKKVKRKKCKVKNACPTMLPIGGSVRRTMGSGEIKDKSKKMKVKR